MCSRAAAIWGDKEGPGCPITGRSGPRHSVFKRSGDPARGIKTRQNKPLPNQDWSVLEDGRNGRANLGDRLFQGGKGVRLVVADPDRRLEASSGIRDRERADPACRTFKLVRE